MKIRKGMNKRWLTLSNFINMPIMNGQDLSSPQNRLHQYTHYGQNLDTREIALKIKHFSRLLFRNPSINKPPVYRRKPRRRNRYPVIYYLPMMISPNISSLPASTSSSSADDSVKSVCGSGGAVNPVIKFLCSYGGMILPRYSDGKLRYVGGETRVLAVDRSVTFSELLTKMGELRGGTSAEMTLRCQLPSEDLDALISIRSDDDLLNVIEEYDLANRNRSSTSSSLKIRSFLSFPSSSPKSPRHILPNPPAFTAPPPIPPRMVPPPQPASASFYMPSLYQRRHLQHYH